MYVASCLNLTIASHIATLANIYISYTGMLLINGNDCRCTYTHIAIAYDYDYSGSILWICLCVHSYRYV